MLRQQPFSTNISQLESFLSLSRASQLAAMNIANALGNPVRNRPPTASVLPRPPIYLTERQHCLLFVKVLFKYLAKANMSSLQGRVKAVVARCIRQNQQLPGNELPLVDKLDRELRQCLGDDHWNRVRKLYSAYCAKQNLHMTPANQMQAI